MGGQSTVLGETFLAPLEKLGLEPIGTSTEGRPIGLRRFGDGPAAPLIVLGGVHGDEPASVEAAVELCERLTIAPPARPVWVIPALNPDGVHRGTKNSARDVDINRNFPAKNFSTVHKAGYFPGPFPGSEPETRALVDLVESFHPDGVVAIHAPFACVNYDGPARVWAERIAAACGWPVQADIGYPTPGSFGSWLGIERGIPVITLELPPGNYAGFREPAQSALQSAINPGRIM